MVPTMRCPTNVNWDREVVYECMWSLLCAIDVHNSKIAAGNAADWETPIRSLLITPLATGVGRITPQRWAEQTVLAMRHFAEARVNGSRWEALDWEEVGKIDDEVRETWEE